MILPEPELRFGTELSSRPGDRAELRSPDIAGWRVERYEEPEDNPITLVPDWICEVLSPSTALTDRTEKMPLYAAHGVGHLWIVDPRAETLEAHRLEGGTWVVASIHGADENARPEPFVEVPLDLAAEFRRPPSPKG